MSVPNRDRGAVTVEAAVALCSLVVVLAVVLAGLSAVTGQLRCTDAAAAVARMLIRGQYEQAHRAVRRRAPQGAQLRVRVHGRMVTVTVVAQALGGLLPGVELRGSAAGVLEPGVDPARVAEVESAHA